MKIVFLLLPILLLGCSSQSKMESMPMKPMHCEDNSSGAMAQAAMAGRMDIMTSSGLTEDQKSQFMQVMNDTHEKVRKIKQKEGEIKAGLFRSLAEGVYDKHLVKTSKAELQKLEKEKMNLMYSSLDRVKLILGDNKKLDPEIFRGFHDHLLF